MGFIKKLLGLEQKLKGEESVDKLDHSNFGEKNSTPMGKSLSEGDLFYTFSDGEYHICKLLKFDSELDTYHVLIYQPNNELPAENEIKNLSIFAYHAPIDKNGFNNPTFLAESKISSDDLSGYHEYLRQVGSPEIIIATAKVYYLKGNELAENKQYEKSIDEYSKAIDLFPQFYEAIENRAFSKMDMGKWNEAIEDFQLSLIQFPESLSGLFSIGECYLKMGKVAQSEEWFKKTLEVDSSNKLASTFLTYTAKLRQMGIKDEDNPSKINVLINNFKQSK